MPSLGSAQTPELEAFARKWNLDDAAMALLCKLPANVQAAVVKQFDLRADVVQALRDEVKRRRLRCRLLLAASCRCGPQEPPSAAGLRMAAAGFGMAASARRVRLRCDRVVIL